jgi:hypothetical protein
MNGCFKSTPPGCHFSQSSSPASTGRLAAGWDPGPTGWWGASAPSPPALDGPRCVSSPRRRKPSSHGPCAAPRSCSPPRSCRPSRRSEPWLAGECRGIVCPCLYLTAKVLAKINSRLVLTALPPRCILCVLSWWMILARNPPPDRIGTASRCELGTAPKQTRKGYLSRCLPLTLPRNGTFTHA